MNSDEKFMREALKEARKANDIDEVPIGCVIVKDNKIIARGHNKKEIKNDATSHAEMEAIRKASKKLNSWRLNDCELYVTLEPCIMCSGAIYQSRIKRVIYGAKDPKGGAIDSIVHTYEIKELNHHPFVTSGILENECSDILKKYFKNKRIKNK